MQYIFYISVNSTVCKIYFKNKCTVCGKNKVIFLLKRKNRTVFIYRFTFK